MTFRKCIWLLPLLCTWISSLSAQDSTHFLYIQSDHSQLFYVKMDGELLSSTSGGYLIIPRLNQGDKTFVIGFPRNEYPEETFQVRIAPGKDRGFLLRKDPDNKFALYDLGDFRKVDGAPVPASGEMPPATPPATALTASGSTPVPAEAAPAPDTSPQHPDNGFRNLLAAVTHQNLPQEQVPLEKAPTRKTNPSANNPGTLAGPWPGTPSRSGNGDTTNSGPDTLVQKHLGSTVPAPTILAATVKPLDAASGTDTLSSTSGHQDSSGTSRIEMEARPLDSASTAAVNPFAAGGGTDTASSPVEKMDSMEAAMKGKVARLDSAEAGLQKGVAPAVSPVSQTDSLAGGASSKIAANPQNQLHFLNFTTAPQGSPDTSAQTAQSQDQSPSAVQPPPGLDSSSAVPMINSDCTNLIKDEKFIKVRRKMALESNPDKMLELATRYFAEDCYTVEQIQSLAFLFNSDEYRYRLLDMAYPHTFDTDHYGRLIHTLSDPYYIGRFKAMLKR